MKRLALIVTYFFVSWRSCIGPNDCYWSASASAFTDVKDAQRFVLGLMHDPTVSDIKIKRGVG